MKRLLDWATATDTRVLVLSLLTNPVYCLRHWDGFKREWRSRS